MDKGECKRDIENKAKRFKRALGLNKSVPGSVKYEGEIVTEQDIDNLLVWLKMEGHI